MTKKGIVIFSSNITCYMSTVANDLYFREFSCFFIWESLCWTCVAKKKLICRFPWNLKELLKWMTALISVNDLCEFFSYNRPYLLLFLLQTQHDKTIRICFFLAISRNLHTVLIIHAEKLAQRQKTKKVTVRQKRFCKCCSLLNLGTLSNEHKL